MSSSPAPAVERPTATARRNTARARRNASRTSRVPLPPAVLRRVHRDAHHPARLRRVPEPLREQAHRRRGLRGTRELRPRADGSRASSASLGRAALFFLIQVPIMLGLALFFALALDSGRARGVQIHPPAHLHAVRGARAWLPTLMWGYLYGHRLRTRSRSSPVQSDSEPREVPGAREHPRLDDEHRHVGVRRLQHDHHVRGPASRSRRNSTRRPRSMAPVSSASRGA